MLKKAWLFALIASAPAVGQTTECRWVGSVWTCTEQPGYPPPPPPRYNPPPVMSSAAIGQGVMDGFTQGQEAARRDAERKSATARNAEDRGLANEAEEAPKIVGDYLKRGDCDGAVLYALSAGEIQLATLAKGPIYVCDPQFVTHYDRA